MKNENESSKTHLTEPIPMTLDPSSQQSVPQTIAQLLQQAIAHHQSGQLLQAGELYQTILQSQPNHPEVNFNLGVIAVQVQQPAAGLPYFMAALDADPSCGKYWLNYIDALFQAGQPEEARAVIRHLKGFEPKVAAQLERETGLAVGNLI